ncbi:MAG TPA: sugar ABC transporter permease [bacterium]|nr:sugar ABC transporter permease [bacterium]
MKQNTFIKSIKQHPYLYLFALPAIVFFVMIRVVPVLGSIIAWQDFQIFRGIWGSPWVGWDNFIEMFRYSNFFRIFRNTLLIGLYRIVFGFPVPIILALLLNEVGRDWFKRFVQTTIYLPYFLSWIVVAQLFMSILNPDTGIVNSVLSRFFGVKPIFFFVKEQLFQPLATLTYIWKTSGYQSIIYLAALTTIDPNLYEAASIDGASRWQQMWKITIPYLMPTIMILLLLAIGQFMRIGFDQIYNLMNPLVQSTADIFDTYVYRVGLLEGQYSFTAAVGVFKSLVGVILLVGANLVARKMMGAGLFK